MNFDLSVEEADARKKRIVLNTVLVWLFVFFVIIGLGIWAGNGRFVPVVAYMSIFPLFAIATVVWGTPRFYEFVTRAYASSGIAGVIGFLLFIFLMTNTHRPATDLERIFFFTIASFMYGCFPTGMIMFSPFAPYKANPFFTIRVPFS